mgnify:CR=1 FL=1
MKYAVFGDVHANLEALQTVLAACEDLGVDKYLCIGDIVGYNADPGPCVDVIRELDVEVCIKGNHDEQASCDTELVGFNPQAAMAIEWTRQQLSAEQKEWLASLPYQQTVGPKMTLVHATLDMPRMWGYIFDKLTAAACLNYQFTQVCFFGHTHVPLAFDKFGDVEGGRYDEIHLEPGHKYLVNVCSVGQPRDGDPRAGFVTFSPEDRRVELHRVKYDLARTQDKILRAGLPERLAQRLAFGR